MGLFMYIPPFILLGALIFALYHVFMINNLTPSARIFFINDSIIIVAILILGVVDWFRVRTNIKNAKEIKEIKKLLVKLLDKKAK